MSISKKTKTDIIAASIKKYLAARNIDQQPKLQVSLEEHALNSVIERECSLRNAISYNPDSLDYQTAETQYSNFKVWISNSPDHYKPELAQLLYPLFSHIYIRLLSLTAAPTAAHRFHARHLSTFQVNPEFKQFIQQLGEISSIDEIQHCPSISNFISARYCVTLTHHTYKYLISYLENTECSLVLTILNQEVDVMVGDWLGAGSRHDYRSGLLTPPLSENSMTSTEDADKEEVDKFQDLIKIIRDGSPAAPSIALYRIHNPEEVCLNAQVDLKSMHMVSGGEDSQVRLWRLQPADEPINIDITSSTVKLGCDTSNLTNNSDNPPRTQTTQTSYNGIARHLRGHTGSVYEAIFTPDDKYILTGSEDTSVRLWDKTTCACLSVYNGHMYPVWCVACDTIGTTFVTGSMDRTARLWNPEFPHPLRIYAGHEQDVDCVAFHPNGGYVLTGSSDRTVRMWNSWEGKCVRVLTGHKGVVCTLKVSPCGRVAASAGEDKKIRIWDLNESKLVKELKGHTDRVTNLVWGDSRLLCSAAQDNTIRVWDIGLGDSELRETYQYPGTIIGLNLTDTNNLVGVTRDCSTS